MHLIGIFMVFLALGGAVVRACLQDESKDLKRMIGFTFGLGMILVIYGGMSLMVLREYAKGGMPAWLVTKLVLWFVFGFSSGQMPRLRRMEWAVVGPITMIILLSAE